MKTLSRILFTLCFPLVLLTLLAVPYTASAQGIITHTPQATLAPTAEPLPSGGAADETPAPVSPVVVTLAMVVALAFAANRLTEAVAAPIKQRNPNLDTWWLLYVSWVFGAGLVFLTGFNLFAGWFPSPVIGQLVTALVIGGGGNILDNAGSLLAGLIPTSGETVIALDAMPSSRSGIR